MKELLRKGTLCILLTVDLVILEECCLIDHDTANFMLVLALQRLDEFIGFMWLEVPVRVVRCIWRRGRTMVDFGDWNVQMIMHEIYPASE